MPASFRGARFHVAAGSQESGRRVVVHEYPKKELPYAEDMGKRATEFNVRGYLIVYPTSQTSFGRQSKDLRLRNDYRPARNALIKELERVGPGTLQLPSLPAMMVACQRYRLTEEERFGGYCTFDMQFIEFGQRPFTPASTFNNLAQQANSLTNQTSEALTKEIEQQEKQENAEEVTP